LSLASSKFLRREALETAGEAEMTCTLPEFWADRNSLLYWLPVVQDCGVPTPVTEIVMCDEERLMPLLDGQGFFPKDVGRALKRAGDRIGYPLFMRTDQLSGKHEWFYTCYVSSADQLRSHAVALVQESCMEFGVASSSAFALRQFLHLDAAFLAFQGLPISCERRLFVEEAEVQCVHPYWPENAIQFYYQTNEPDDWRNLLAALNARALPDDVIRWAISVGKALGEAWSIDFARDKAGGWWLIDMALAGVSWHPEDCPNRWPDPREALP